MKLTIKEIIIFVLAFLIIGSFGAWEVGNISLIRALMQSAALSFAIYIINFFDKKRAAFKATQQPNL